MLKKRTIFQKIFISTVLFILVTLGLSHGLNIVYQYRENARRTVKNNVELSENINNLMDEYFQQIEGTISSIYYDLFQNRDGALSRLYLTRKDFIDAYIYVNPDKKYCYSEYGGMRVGYHPEDEEWFQETLRKNGRTHIVMNEIPEQITYNKPVISVIRLLKNVDNEGIEKNAVIRLDFAVQYLEKMMQYYILDEDTTILIVDEKDNIVHQVGNTLEFSDAQEKQKFFEDTAQEHKIGKEKYIYTCSEVDSYAWRVVSVINMRHVYNMTKNYIVIVVETAVLLCILAAVFCYLYVKNMTRPILELEKGMDGIRDGNFDIFLEKNTEDELGHLIDIFNTMAQKIRTLIREKYEAELAMKDAQYKYLQAQIDPHFIFNTLQIISSVAMVNRQNEIETLSNSLARLIRYSISGDAREILLKEELKNVKSYLEIQKIRFRNRISYEIQTDISLEGLYVIKLILQPIVENAISHGLEECEEMGKIEIKVFREEDVMITISDNGVGMDRETLDNLLVYINAMPSEYDLGDSSGRLLEEARKSGNHVGLRNINQRLKLFYGEAYRLRMESVKGKGTRVTVRIPEKGRDDDKIADCR